MTRFDILQGHFLFWLYWNTAGLTKRDKARRGRLSTALVLSEMPQEAQERVYKGLVTGGATVVYQNLVKLYYPLK
jgi:hypothetical protein